jgi:hypothetical protein
MLSRRDVLTTTVAAGAGLAIASQASEPAEARFEGRTEHQAPCRIHGANCSRPNAGRRPEREERLISLLTSREKRPRQRAQSLQVRIRSSPVGGWPAGSVHCDSCQFANRQGEGVTPMHYSSQPLHSVLNPIWHGL